MELSLSLPSAWRLGKRLTGTVCAGALCLGIISAGHAEAQTVSSASNQSFTVGDAPTAAVTITITDDAVTPTITKKNELRVRIPSGFPMSWDTSILTVTIGGPAAGKMKTKLKAYEDGGKTAVLDVGGDFAAGDQITVDGLTFQGFAAPAAADNLEIDVDNDQVGDATDDKTIDIVAGASVNISSASNQEFNIGDAPTAVAIITLADASTPTITAANDLRIRIPSTFDMSWDSTDLTVTLGGTAAASVSTTVTYEDSDQTLVLDVTTDFLAGDYVTIADLSFTNFTRAGSDNLELEVANDDVVSDTDDKTVIIRGPIISSAVDQLFTVNDPATAAALITITDDPIARTIQKKRDIRIRIPAGFNMEWDTSVTSVTLGGTGAGDVDTNLLAYEDGNKTAVLDVTNNFNPGDTLTVNGLSFTNFTAESALDNLELEVNDDTNVSALDDQTIRIRQPSLLSASNQFFNVSDPATPTQALTVTDTLDIPPITALDDIRIRIPAGINMVWDGSDTTATIGGGASGKVATTVTYEDAGRTLVLDVTSDFVNGDSIVVSDLSFTTFSDVSPTDNLELVVTGAGGATDEADDRTITIVRYGPSSGVSQVFIVFDPATVASTITVSDSAAGATITAANDIRLRIPTGFNMTWDTAVVSVTLNGGAAGKVSGTISGYEDSDQTVVLDVTSDFAIADTVTIDDLRFANFTATSPLDNLELDIDNNGVGDRFDDKTILIVAPTISSAAHQTFTVADADTLVSAITVTDSTASPTILAADDIRIRIPAALNMTWNTADFAATIGGGAAAKVSTTVSYEDGGKTLVLDVTGDFVANDQITVSDVSFSSFSAASGVDNLELVIRGAAGPTVATDDKTKAVFDPLSVSSAANQIFNQGQAPTAISVITVTEDGGPTLTALNDLRIRIPAGFNMTWDNTDVTATIGGPAAAKVSGAVVGYEDSDHTLVLDILTDFAAGDAITIADLSFANFTAPTAADNLELVDAGAGGATAAVDDKTVTVVNPYGVSSAANQVFTVSDPATAATDITITDDAVTATITAANDLRIRIPTGFNMVFDTGVGSVTLGGSGSGKVSATLLPYENGNQTAVLDVTADFAPGDFITVSGLAFTNFTAISASDNLELDIDNNGVGDLFDDKTVLIVAPAISSAANQTFTVADADTLVSTIAVTDSTVSPSILAVDDIRIRIPAALNMTWDATDFTATIGGAAAAKVSTAVSYEDGGKTLVLDVIADFAASDPITVSDVSFSSFTAVSGPDNLELVVHGAAGPTAVTDDKTKAIFDPLSLSSAANQLFNQGQAPTAISVITVTEDGGPTLTAVNDLRVRIPVGFNMTWDNTDLTATIGGPAAAKVSGAVVGYEDSDHTLVLNILTDFVPGDAITIADLSFTNFTIPTASDNLELVDAGAGGATAVEDDKTVAVLNVYGLSSAANQSFTVNDPATAAAVMTITDDAVTATVTAANDLRIRIPTGFNMVFDTGVGSVTLGGSGSGKVSATLLPYENGNQTAVLDVTTDFAPGDLITVSGLAFTNFAGVSASDNLELDIDNNGVGDLFDDKTLLIVTPTISSAANQVFTVSDADTLVSAFTVTDSAVSPSILAADDIRIRIPAALNMTWDATDFTATIGGAAAAKVSTTVSYEDGGKTLVLNVTADFAASDPIIVSDVSFSSFTAASSADNLELVVHGAAGPTAVTDDKTKIIYDPLSLSSAANQVFNQSQAPTAISVITVTEDGGPTLTAANDLRIRIPAGFNMTWDNTDLTATIGGPAAAKVAGVVVGYEDSDHTLVLDILTDFAVGDSITIADLSFANFTSPTAADNLELVDAGAGGATAATDDKTVTVIDVYGLSSVANQIFTVNDPATTAADITFTDDATTATITAANDFRIRIPAGFNMIFDTGVGSVTLGGSASGKVSATLLPYENGNQTAVLDVTTNFAPGDLITVSGLAFTNFTAASALDNLELDIDNNGVGDLFDDKTLLIVTPAISSAASQNFTVGDADTLVSTITVTDSTVSPSILAADDIRIRIPAALNMTWDSADFTATIGGGAAAKVSTTVSYEDGGKTLVLDVTVDFAASDQITVSDVSFSSFTAASGPDNLELVVHGAAGPTAVTDDKTVTIFDALSLSSAADQAFNQGDAATAISIITIADDGSPTLTDANNLRIRIPAGLNMTWDNTDLTATIGGPAAAKVSGAVVGYEDSDHTLVLDITSDFAPGDQITIADLSFANFTAPSVADNLELVDAGAGGATAVEDDKTLTVVEPYGISSALNQSFTVGDPATAASLITITDEAPSPTITASNDLRLRIPAGFDMKFDTGVTAVTLGGTGAGKVSATLLAYEDGDKTAVLDVTTDFASGDQITVSGFTFIDFLTPSPVDNLELDIDNNGAGDLFDDKTITIFAPLSLSSAADQIFNEGDLVTPIATVTVTDDASPSITAANNLRIRIPATFNMTWDASDLTAVLGGTAAAKVSTTVSYEDSDQTLVLTVTTNFAIGDQLTVTGLGFDNFSAPSAVDNLELVDGGPAGPTAATDTQSVTVVDPYGISSAADQVFTLNDPATSAALITITEEAPTPTITAANDLRIRIPAGFAMTFDTSVAIVALSGTASGSVSTTLLAYEDGNQTAVLDVTTDFAAGDQLTVSGLAFANFTAVSASDNLELEVGNDGGLSATDTRTIVIVAPTLTSAASQIFTVGDPVTPANVKTVTDSAVAPSIVAADDIRIRIPAGFNMTWDTTDTTATIGGSALGKVSSTVSYEDAGQTLVLDVTTDFAAGDQITVSDLGFDNFSALSASDNLELVVSGASGPTAATDDKTIQVFAQLSFSSAANQIFNQNDAATPMSLVTLTEDASPSVTMANDLRIRIPATFNMTWDTTDTTATIGGPEAANLDPNVSYENGGRTLVLTVVTDFGPGDSVTISGLGFTNFSAPSAADNLEMVDAGAAGPTKIEDANTIEVIDRYGILSAASQVFTINDPTTASSLLTITEDGATPTITDANDLRIRIPSGFNMTFDPTVLAVTLGGSASATVSATLLAYEDGNQTAVLEVTTDFAVADQITVSGLAFTSFTAPSAPDNLELEVGNDGVVSSTAPQTITIVVPTLSAAANQSFTVSDPVKASEVLTVTDSAVAPSINAADDIRIRIPAGFNMTWDTADTTATIGGSALAKVSSSVSYEDAGQTLVLDVTADFAAGDQITISDLGFDNFSATSAADNLELVVAGASGPTAANADKTILILDPLDISSAANQDFNQDDAVTAISTITVTEDGTPTITAANDLRIRIPATFNMTWDASDMTAVIGGAASAKVSTTVSYEDSDQTLVLDVTSDFAPGDQITVAGLGFAAFSAPSAADSLELVDAGAGGPTATEDDKTLTIIDRYGLSSAVNQTFTVGNPPTAAATITITDDAVTPTITKKGELRIRVPSTFPMTWDTSIVTVTIGGPAAGKMKTKLKAYEDGGKTAVVDVNGDFAAGDQITVSGLTFSGFAAPALADNLELDVDDDGGADSFDDKTIDIVAGPTPNIISAANQEFFFADPTTAISTITVADAATPVITAANDLRIRIPGPLVMTWDTSDTTVTLGGPAAAKVLAAVAYEDGGKTLVLDVTSDFVADDYITFSDLSFTNFDRSSGPDNLELEVANDDVVTDTDDKTVTIRGPRLVSGVDQVFVVGDPVTAAALFTITDDLVASTIKKKRDVRLRIPAGFAMEWDTTVTTITVGGPAAGSVSATLLAYEDGNKTAVIDVTKNFNAGDQITIDDLRFTNFSAVSGPDNLELEVNDDGVVSGLDTQTITIVQPTISSAADQFFTVGDPVTPANVKTVTDSAVAPSIVAADDIRIRIPAGFSMTWDTTDITATIGGSASGKVSSTVSYEDGGQTLVIDVTTDFAAGDQITIDDLGFHNFTGATSSDNLELVVAGASGPTAVTDDKTIRVFGPLSFSSAANQFFNQDDAATPMSLLTLTEDATPSVTMANDLRIRIPATFNMAWDTTDTVATIGGPEAANLDPNVSYEDGGRTLVIPVVTDFGQGDSVAISGLSFTNFSAPSAADNLEMVDGGAGGPTKIEDANTIAIFDRYGATSASDQIFTVNDFTTAAALITITEDANVTTITAANELRLRVPAGFNMLWDTTIPTATIGGASSGKVSGTLLAYEDGGRTAVLDVTTDFAPQDQITVSGLAFTSFTATSAPDNLELEVGNDDIVSALDKQTVTIIAPTLSSAANQQFSFGDPVTPADVITVTDSAGGASINATDDIRIRIPAGFAMTWDSSDLTAIIGGPASAKVSGTVSYEDGGQTLVVNVTTNFAPSDQVTIDGVGFDNFTALAPTDNLELIVAGLGGQAAVTDDKTIRVFGPLTLSSAANQFFNEAGAPMSVSLITVTEDGSPSLNTTDDLRVRIPATFNMTWDTTDITATIGGPQAAKLDVNVSYENGDQTLVIPVLTDFAAGDEVTLSGLSFANFTVVAPADNLELVDSGAGGGTAVEDDKTITIIERYGITSASNQVFVVDDPPTTAAVITITDDVASPTMTAANDLRIRIPAGFNATWDETVTGVPIGGAAAAKVSTLLLAYEDGGKTAVIDILSDFVPGDQITIAGLRFTGLSTPSPVDNLELEVFNDDVVSATDDKTITTIGGPNPTLLSTADQLFFFNYPSTPISPITVSDATVPAITAANDIRIRIPAGFNMTWDSSITTATIGGVASGRVSTTVSYEDADATLVLDVTSDFVVGDYITLQDVNFTNFNSSASDNLELLVDGGTSVVDEDRRTIAVFSLTLSADANQVFSVGAPPTSSVRFTITDDINLAMIKKKVELRIRIPASFPMFWDTTVESVSIGGIAADKMKTNLKEYEDSGKTLVLDVKDDFDEGDQITVDGLAFEDFASSAAPDFLLLDVGIAGITPRDDKTVEIIAGSASILSAYDQIFNVGSPSTPIATLTVSDAAAPLITKKKDIRIRIPAGFAMTWDTSITTATYSGTGASKLKAGVSYEDADHTLVVDVGNDFAGGDWITITDVNFTNFTALEAQDNLELVVDGSGGSTLATDGKIIAITDLSMMSASNQVFTVGAGSTVAATITITDDTPSGLIEKKKDLRIHIPPAFPMRWDTSVTTVTLGGTASAKAKTKLKKYEDDGKTAVINVEEDFNPGDTLTIDDLKFLDFGAPTPVDRLELETRKDDQITAFDTQTIEIVPGAGVNILSASDQIVTFLDPSFTILPVTIADAATPVITAANDIRIRIPAGVDLTWDTSIVNVFRQGTATPRVSTLATYEDAGKTLVLDVISDFVAGDYVTLSGAAFTNLGLPSSGAMDLLIDGGTVVADTDDHLIILHGVTISSAVNQSLNVGDPATPAATITITADTLDDKSIRKKKDIRITIPAVLPMTWDTSVTTVTYGGTGAGRMKADLKNYEDGGRTAVLDVAKDFKEGEFITVDGLGFDNFASAGGPDNLELTLDKKKGVVARDDKTITLVAATTTITSASDQQFFVGDPSTPMSTISISHDAITANIKKASDIRIRIPATFNMTWDTSITTVTLGGTEAGNVSTTLLAYEDAGRTAVLDVTSDFGLASSLTVSGLSATSFTAASAIDNLELEVDNLGNVIDEDGRTIRIVELSLSSAVNQTFTVGDPTAAAATLTVTDDLTSPQITAIGNIRIRIPVGVNTTWDTSVTSVTLGGSAAGKVAATLPAYEDGAKTMVLNVFADFVGGDQITIGGLQFLNFPAPSAADNLELEIFNDGSTNAFDDKTLTIQPGLTANILSAADQTFYVGDPATPIQLITIADASTLKIKAATDIRVRIPAGFNMTWDTSDTTAVIGGAAAAKVSPTVAFEDSNRTLVLTVSSDFVLNDWITVSGLGFDNFTSFSAPTFLELEVDNLGGLEDSDDKFIHVSGLSLSSAANQVFATGDPSTLASIITITEDPNITTIKKKKDLRISIPTTFPMKWDDAVTSITIGGPAAAKVKAKLKNYEDAGKTAVVDVAADFAAGDQVTIDGLRFIDFARPSAGEPIDVLQLRVEKGASVVASDDKTKTVTAGATVNILSDFEQNFDVGAPPTLAATITITDATTPTITKKKRVRITIPSTLYMIWDTSVTDLTVTGTGAAKIDVPAIRNYLDADKTVELDVNADFAAGEWIALDGLRLVNFASPSVEGLTLSIDGGATVADTDDNFKSIGGVTISSAANQVFAVGDPPTAAAIITITDDANTRSIKKKKDLRIHIPTTLPMKWDETIKTVTIGGGAAGKVKTKLKRYEDNGRTAVIDVSKDFNAGEQVTIDGLQFTDFAGSDTGYLELEIGNDGQRSSIDDKTITINAGLLSILSDYDQYFHPGDPPTTIALITISNHVTTKEIQKGVPLKVRIPSTFNMDWDTSINTISVGGTAAGRVDTTLLPYEDGGQTLVIDVTKDFNAGEYLTISGPAFDNFTASSPLDNLELEVYDDGAVTDDDDKTIAIIDVMISSAANQLFTVGDPATAVSTITITEDAVQASISALDEIRIRIPLTANLTWDISDLSVLLGGTASGKVSTTLLPYEDGGKTVVLDVTANFAATDTLTIDGLTFANFTAPSSAQSLGLDIFDTGTDFALDDKTVQVVAPGSALMLSANDQTFFVGHPSTGAASILVSDATIASITAANDIRIRIPAGFNMTWDTSITSVTLSGPQATNVLATLLPYEDSGRTMVVDVGSDFGGGDTFTVSGMRFQSFTAPSAADNLELVIAGAGGVTEDEDNRTITITDLTLSSAADQFFSVGQAPTAAQTITVRDASSAPTITAVNDIRIRVPAGFSMTWDSSVTTVTLGGAAAGRLSTTPSYEDSDQTVVLNVISDFAASDAFTITGLSFSNFTAVAPGDNLELEVGNNGVAAAVDDKLISILDVVYRSIGTNTAILHNTGVATVPVSTRTVTLSVALPANVGIGDRIVLDPGGPNQETHYIASVVDANTVTLQADVALDHSGGDAFEIERAYNSLPDWESDREGDLVQESRVEYGMMYNDGAFVDPVVIDGSTTDSLHKMRLIAAPGQAHNGTDGTGVVIDGQDAGTTGVSVRDDYFYMAGAEFTSFRGGAGAAAIDVQSASNVVLNRLLIYDFDDGAFDVSGIEAGAGADFTVRNSILFGGDTGIRGTGADATVTLDNVTVFGMSGTGLFEDQATFDATNVISMNNALDFSVVNGSQTKTLSSDGSGTSVGVASTQFISIATGLEDLHLAATAVDAIDLGTDLSAQFGDDIDGNRRKSTWDLGAHEFAAATEVTLVSFAADALDGAVLLRWETSSELTNLGFNLYRATAEDGTYDLITLKLVPGLGSSLVGASYSYTDQGLTNDTTYYYKLEDVETTGVATLHGPVSAMPHAGATAPPPEETPGGSTSGTSRITYGDPTNVSFRELERTDRYVVLELITGGFLR